MKNLLAICVTFIIVGSCTQKVLIDLPYDKPMPVMNSLLASDSAVYVDLTYSKSIKSFATGFESIANAQVRLFADGQLVETLAERATDQSRVYYSGYKIKQGQKINIEAQLADATILLGETVVPSAPEISEVRGKRLTEDAFGNVDYQFNVTLNDKGFTKDYYQLKIYPVSNGVVNKNLQLFSTITNLKRNQGGVFDNFTDNQYNGISYFDDETFNGQSFNLNIQSHYYGELDKVAVELIAISESAYLYFRSIALQDLRNNDPLYEKVKVYSNIKNGLGILGALSSSIVYLNLDE